MTHQILTLNTTGSADRPLGVDSRYCKFTDMPELGMVLYFYFIGKGLVYHDSDGIWSVPELMDCFYLHLN